MGVRILESRDGESVLYCSTTGWAFGPVFDSRDLAEAFSDWHFANHGDPRLASDLEMECRYSDFRRLACCAECGEFMETWRELTAGGNTLVCPACKLKA